MKVTTGGASVAAGVVCLGACAASLGLGGVFVGMTAGGALAFLTGEVVQVALLATALTGAWYWYRRFRTIAEAKACDCAADAGCNTGPACDLPQPGLILPKD